ncbi:hypothetical protein ABZ606_02850 [Streptomyces sp. NPDC012461]|uniref:hypothetical protein n=1 Tax=Streptomyces sp. NPDC012461 TaxID=3155117 RepID=UPI0033E5A5B1
MPFSLLSASADPSVTLRRRLREVRNLRSAHLLDIEKGRDRDRLVYQVVGDFVPKEHVDDENAIFQEKNARPDEEL